MDWKDGVAKRLKHWNKNRRCRDPFNLHPSQSSLKGLREVSRSFARKYAEAGCYEGQNLCCICRNHVYKKYGKSAQNKENIDQDIPAEDPPNITVQNDEIPEVTNAYNYQQLKSINEQIIGLPASEIIATNDKRILDEGSFLQIELV